MKKADYLAQILQDKKQEVGQLVQATQGVPNHPLNQVLHQSRPPSKRFSLALKQSTLAVIGEVKRKSPSLGEIRAIQDPVKLARQYCQGGVSAISVLTDRKAFNGSLADLSQVTQMLKKDHSPVALLRKDFIFHPLQLAEAVLAGADAVLLIVHNVGNQLQALLQEAHRLGLEVLTEVHDRQELELALEAEAPIIGINHRNLTTFEVHLSLSETLRPLIPPHIITVAESGIDRPVKAKRMRELGFDAILVGEALVRAHDPTNLIQQMRHT